VTLILAKYKSQPWVKTIKNGWEKLFTIFTRISFYSVGNGNGKDRNEIRSVKFDLLKTDKSEKKISQYRSTNGNLNQKYDNIEK
jgi:hypothetical protein